MCERCGNSECAPVAPFEQCKLYESVANPRDDLWGGKSCDVPVGVAVCPECGNKLYVYCWSWVEETGQPYGDELQIDCENISMYDSENDDDHHKYRQSDWQGVVDAIRTWAGAI